MALAYRRNIANSPTLKRSFTAVTTSTPPSPDRQPSSGVFTLPALPSGLPEERHMSFPIKRRQSSDNELPNMPVAAGPQAFPNFPSFMSVYSIESVANFEQKEAVAAADTALALRRDNAYVPQQEHENINTQTHLHQHRDSTSTQASESTDSSPTTTISTADSSSLTDPSPSSSPESPITIIPLSSFSSTTFGIHSLDDLTMSETPLPVKEPLSLSLDRPMTSPSQRKPRNAKNLALKLSPVGDLNQQISSPASPAFVKPPPPKPRKKPSQLSLQTTATSNPMARLALEVPPTPHDSRPSTLLHRHSSPQMSLFSPDPRGGPTGGMQLPKFERSKISGLSTVFRKDSDTVCMGGTIDEEESPIRTQLATRSTQDIRGDVFDVPASQEDAQSPGYPDGPIAIYEPYVYLYLEPTADEASKFDVIMNVAQEVKNPFKAAAEEPKSMAPPVLNFDTIMVDRDDIPVPDTASSMATFTTAFEFQPLTAREALAESSPTTPKPPTKKEPEYIHVPWEHNTDISKELMSLCETIENRTKQGKRVLVHCQQGASRSASLIIAYGMYLNPSLDVSTAYDNAQKKSRWISPNMKLMYALQDFKKEIDKKAMLGGGVFRRPAGRSPSMHRLTVSADTIEFPSSSRSPPQTAPLPTEREKASATSGTSSRARSDSTPNFGGEILPGPSSAPSSYVWTPTPKASQTPDYQGLWTPAQSSMSPVKFSFNDDPKNTFPSFPPNTSENTPPASEPASPPIAQGFGFHRSDHQSTRRMPSPLFTSSAEPSPLPLSLGGFGSLNRQFAGGAVPPTPSLWSPRIKEMTGSTGSAMTHNYSGGSTDVNFDDVPPTPSIMSPRASEFANPFGAMGFSSMAHPGASTFGRTFAVPPPLSGMRDPRSPPIQGEAPIIRSIDDML